MNYIAHKKPSHKLVLIGSLLVVVLGGWLIWSNIKDSDDEPAENSDSNLASAQQIEGGYADSLKGFLETEDYEQYQISARSVARHYFSTQDYDNAERVMQDLVTKVPAGDIDATSYILLAAIHKARGDGGKEDEFLNKAADILRAAGNSAEADALVNGGG